MAAIIFNIAKGKFARYAMLPEAADALIWSVAKSAGLQADSVLIDYDTLADIYAAANDEATFAGYARVTGTGVTVTVDDTNDRTDVDLVDPAWSPTAAEAIGAIILSYDNDTGAGTDANQIPLFKDDFALTTPTTGSVTYQVAAAGCMRAA